jgi:hypothetical protein
MKALTLHQPWASLIAVAAKLYETRSWATSYRGPIAIHAGKNTDYLGLLDEDPFRSALIDAGFPTFRQHGWDWLSKQEIPLGSVVAVATLAGCFPTERYTTRPDAAVGRLVISKREEAFGDWTPGRFAWQLLDIHRLAEPIPCRGAQGLWEVPAEIEARIAKEIEEARG